VDHRRGGRGGVIRRVLLTAGRSTQRAAPAARYCPTQANFASLPQLRVFSRFCTLETPSTRHSLGHDDLRGSPKKKPDNPSRRRPPVGCPRRGTKSWVGRRPGVKPRRALHANLVLWKPRRVRPRASFVPLALPRGRKERKLALPDSPASFVIFWDRFGAARFFVSL